MVSIWPWKSGDTSPASFEKALSSLAVRISTTQSLLDHTRLSSRRVRVLCTLYLSFGYLIYAIVLALVVGWRRLGVWEWSGITGGPVIIYIVRAVLGAIYNYRIESLAARLSSQQDERAKTIQKLKDATKYDTTLQLLKKYGEGDIRGWPSDSKGEATIKKRSSTTNDLRETETKPSTPSRTGMPPPLTANILQEHSRATSSMRGMSKPANGGFDGGDDQLERGHSSNPSARAHDLVTASTVIPPNVLDSDVLLTPRFPGGQYATGSASNGGMAERRWYDRILDLLLGDDETAANHRIALICSSCRLVNGQAQPGTRSLSEVGSWRCMGCGALNGDIPSNDTTASDEPSNVDHSNLLVSGEDMVHDAEERHSE